MDTNSHNNIYSAEDIQNYLSGRLSPLQMNAMEKAALEDPFLAEAMEGYAATENDDWKKELAALKESFAQKQLGAKVIPISKKKNNWWKAAAAVVLIGMAATFAYTFFNNKKQGNEIAQNKEAAPVVKADSSPTQTTAVPPAAVQSEDVTVVQAQPAKEYKTVIKDITHAPVEKVADSLFVYTPPAKQATAAPVPAEEKRTDDVVVVTKPAAPSTANALPQGGIVSNNNSMEGYTKNNAAEYDYFKKKADAATASRQETKLNKTFFAQVLSADNTPLPFANISNKNENFGTYADVKGNFRLLSNDSVLTVEVRSAGFKPQLVTLRSNTQQNKIVLTEDNTAFAQSTVINSNSPLKGRISRRAVLVKDSVLNVEPADGWDNYYTYVDNNIEIPDDILKNNIHGQVELSFDVKSNGAITNIKVDKSLCDHCDDAAIRMLQQGPQWKVKKGKKGKGKITVQF